MRGLMMDKPLLISSLIQHAEDYHGATEIVSRTVEGPIHTYTYAEAAKRARQLVNALVSLGVKPGDRIGTLAWNGYRHFETYYAVSGMGAVCHTINPRLFPPQISYIIGHAEDSYLFVDLTFIPLLEGIADSLGKVKGVVVLTDRQHMPESKLPNLLCYEDLVHSHSDRYEWPELDEWTASSLCYTSGTTGNPKGVLYSHRSTVLHSFSIAMPDALSLSSARHRDAGGPDVPRQCLGHALCGADDGRQAGLSGTENGRRQPLRDDGTGRRHRQRRGADHLGGPDPLHAGKRQALQHPDPDHRRRIGGTARHDRDVPGRVRRGTGPCLGHDRNLADRGGIAA